MATILIEDKHFECDEIYINGWKNTTQIEGDDHRWNKDIYQIYESPEGKFYQYEWSEGLTEYQPNDYPTEIKDGVKYRELIEVHRIEKQIIQVEWEVIKEEVEA